MFESWTSDPPHHLLLSLASFIVLNLIVSKSIFCCLLGTTEKIFESKLEVYDVYVDNQNIKCKPHLSWIANFNNADRDRLEELDSFRWVLLVTMQRNKPMHGLIEPFTLVFWLQRILSLAHDCCKLVTCLNMLWLNRGNIRWFSPNWKRFVQLFV